MASERDDGSRFDWAENLYDNAESYAGVVRLRRIDTILRLSTHPSSWILQAPKDGKSFLRRVEWDMGRDPVADWKGRRSFCADAFIEENLFLTVIESFRNLKCPLAGADHHHTLLLTSRSGKSLTYSGNHAETKLTWFHFRSGPWDDLEAWFEETVELFEAELPVSTVKEYRYQAGLR